MVHYRKNWAIVRVKQEWVPENTAVEKVSCSTKTKTIMTP